MTIILKSMCIKSIAASGSACLIYAVAALLVVSGCTSLPPAADYPKTVSAALAHPEDTKLGQYFNSAAQANEGNSGFRIIATGADGFVLRMQMINAAQRSIDLQYYIFHGDETGRLLTGALISAADRGVRVRILIDDGETEPGDEQIAALEGHPLIEVRIFNPFAYRGHNQFLRATEFLFNSARLDYRMHNKLLIIDNAIALIGGRNVGDQYFQIDPDSQFADDDMFSVGPIIEDLSATFDEFWNNKLSIPDRALSDTGPDGHKLNDHRLELKAESRQLKADGVDFVNQIASGEPFNGILAGRQNLVWAHAQLVSDSPDKKKAESGEMVGRLMHRAVFQAVSSVQTELLMITPYFVPGKEGMQMFSDLRAKQVRVRVLTNSLESSTVLLAQSGYIHYRKPLLTAGVELYEIRAHLGNSKGSGQTAHMSSFGNYSLHGKLFVMDRRKLFIGSMNFDQRSMHLNTEIGLLIDSPVLAQQVAARFEAMTRPQNAYNLVFNSDAAHQDDIVWLTQEDGHAVTYLTEPARSGWQRFEANFFALLPIGSEL